MNDTQIDNAKYIDVVMLMSNSNKYSNNYSKTSESLWQYYKDDPNDNKKQSDSFTCRIKVTGKTPAVGYTNDVEIAVPLKYLSNFWRTLEMPLINCKFNPKLTWSENCVISSKIGASKFKITHTKRYVPVVTLPTEDNAQLLQQLKSDFKRTINGNKYHTKLSKERQN